MKEVTLDILQSPEETATLTLKTIRRDDHEVLKGELIGLQKTYSIDSGIPNLIIPAQLLPSDDSFQAKYDMGASQYQQGMDWLFASFHEKEQTVRQQMTDILGAEDDDLILDIGCGTGKDAECLLSRTTSCRVLLADFSLAMLMVAKNQLSAFRKRTDFVACNASYLPFRDEVFDKVFHFGGINEFGDKERAINEFCRVTKPGGKIVFGDEGVAPWLAEKEYGAILRSANPLYNHQPPLELLPVEARHVKLHWILGNAFYLIEFEKGQGAPPLDLDLPIPGKRGGSLRSRFEAGSQDISKV